MISRDYRRADRLTGLINRPPISTWSKGVFLFTIDGVYIGSITALKGIYG